MNELQAVSSSGLTLYGVLLDATGQAWNGSAFETLAGANWTDYALPLTEAAAGIYLATMPAVAAGAYSYIVYEQVGATPATTDKLRGGGSLLWDGANVALPADVPSAGSETVTLECLDASSLPLEGVAVWVTSDSAGATVRAGTLYSNSSGLVTVYLDPGSYFVWRQGGANWSNPQPITVTDV